MKFPAVVTSLSWLILPVQSIDKVRQKIQQQLCHRAKFLQLNDDKAICQN
jgi:hypothetical protein